MTRCSVRGGSRRHVNAQVDRSHSESDSVKPPPQLLLILTAAGHGGRLRDRGGGLLG